MGGLLRCAAALAAAAALCAATDGGDAPAVPGELTPEQLREHAEAAARLFGAGSAEPPAPAAAVPRLLPATWHDPSRLLDTATADFDAAYVNASDLPAAFAAGRAGLTAVPAYGNVVWVPWRLRCGGEPRGDAAPTRAQLCEALTTAVTARLREHHPAATGGGGEGAGASGGATVSLTRAVYATLSYSPDGGPPATVPAPGHLAEGDGAEGAAPSEGRMVPRVGAMAVVDAAVGAVAAAAAAHRFVVGWGFKGEVYIVSHTQPLPPAGSPAPPTAAVGVGADGSLSPPAGGSEASSAAAAAAGAGGWGRALRVASVNVWNSNPPRWLWRWAPDRLRQYALRLAHLADVLGEVGAHVVAFQEVRYDSTLGGTDAELDADPGVTGQNGRRFSDGLATARDWYNRTRAFARHTRYAQRNAPKWAAITRSAGYAAYAGDHPIEAPEEALLASAAPPPGAVDDVSDLVAHLRPEAGVARGSIYAQPRVEPPPGRLEAVWGALGSTPHAQVAHLSAALGGGWFHAHAPAQLYLDPASHAGEPTRDEEGPAIFSRLPIVAADYALLSRDAHDGGDGHQRLVLHAVVDASSLAAPAGAGAGAAPGGGRALVDVYSVHLALSESARNRTVLELLAFMRASAVGSLQLLAGDMNAEPHEPAMRALAAGMAALRAARASAAASAAAGEGDGSAEGAAGAAAPTAGDPTAAMELTYAHRLPPLPGQPAPGPLDAVAGLVAPDSRPLGEQVGDVALATHPLTAPLAAAGGGGAGGRAGRVPSLRDVWLARHPEPVPRDSDAGVRRYGFTFPSDDPVKRIDLLLAGTPEGAPTCEELEEVGAAAAVASAAPAGVCVRVHRAYVAGQDPLPGTEGNEGRRMGMVSEWSPVWASDHRALLAHVSLQPTPPGLLA